ncbi:rCG57371 [Rattus norvegicus]|uniref:RCG57371 n=1 Tax=Rattus norvegicus TaxID=10116 RepID=A6JPF5_RAT|nr:rCG57371 [Rattus norvegicus]
MRYFSQRCIKKEPKWKRLKTINTKIKGSRVSQKPRNYLLTPKRPTSIENIKVKSASKYGKKVVLFSNWKPSSLNM